MGEFDPARLKRVGLLGGSFNPVHIGHLVMARDALERCGLEQVCFLPCAEPPHKRRGSLAPATHRLNMVKAALEGEPRFSWSAIEMERGAVSYTVDTLRELRRRYPGVRWYFIIGGDTLLQLHTWKEIGELLESCTFIPVVRPGFDMDDMTAERMKLPEAWGEALLKRQVAGHGLGVSSTEIRRRRARGLAVTWLVPAAVEHYMGTHGLYQG